MKKITQKQMAFAKLYQANKAGDCRFIPTYEFVGEMMIKNLNTWVMMSYKCPTRLTDLYLENSLLERELITGKSGVKYYGYRIKSGANVVDIKDPIILKFYQELNSK